MNSLTLAAECPTVSGVLDLHVDIIIIIMLSLFPATSYKLSPQDVHSTKTTYVVSKVMVNCVLANM